MLKKLDKYNQLFIQNNLEGQIDKENIFEFDNKNSKIVFSAPHSTRSLRNNKVKASDLYTGALVLLISEMFEYSNVVRNKFSATDDSDLIDFVEFDEDKYFIDVHGMKQDVPFELAVGTGIIPTVLYKREIEIIRILCKRYNISWVLNHPDYHGRLGFISKYQEKYNSKNVIQLEWRLDMRDFYHYPQNILERTIPFLKDLAEALS